MKKSLARFSLVLIAFAITTSLQAQPSLDQTFSGDGYVLTKIKPSNGDIARSVMLQPDGKILVGGNSLNSIGFSDAAIVRFKNNGQYDNKFGTSGIFTIPGGFFCDMALLPNGKIIVAGSGVSTANLNNYIVYRLKKNGSVDSSFGANGKVSVSMSGGNMICYDVALQQDGKIVLGGFIDDGDGGHHTLLVIRLNPNGTLDQNFASGGKFKLNLTNLQSECHQLAIQPNGKIIAGGEIDTLINFSFFRYDFAAVRLNSNGTPDASFGNGGVARQDKGQMDDSYATGILSDGRIVLGGFSDFPGNTQFALLCLKPNGTPDNSFGSGGWTFANFYDGGSLCNALAIESDDDIVMAGDVTFAGGTRAVALAKVLSDGTMDGSFGDGGIDTSFVSFSGMDGCNDVALQPDNKMVIAGYYPVGYHYAFLTARYTNTAVKMAPAVVENGNSLTVYPNPFSDGVQTITYHLSDNSSVTLQLFDAEGRMLASWNEGMQSSGLHSLQVSLAELQAGNYFLVLNTEKGNQTFKIQKTD